MYGGGYISPSIEKQQRFFDGASDVIVIVQDALYKILFIYQAQGRSFRKIYRKKFLFY